MRPVKEETMTVLSPYWTARLKEQDDEETQAGRLSLADGTALPGKRAGIAAAVRLVLTDAVCARRTQLFSLSVGSRVSRPAPSWPGQRMGHADARFSFAVSERSRGSDV